MNMCVRPSCSVKSTVELMTQRTSGTTYVILSERATAPDGDDLGYDICQAAGPLSARESCVIRQHPLGWRPDPGVNIDRLLQTLQEYARETVSPLTSASCAKHSERCVIPIASKRNALSR